MKRVVILCAIVALFGLAVSAGPNASLGFLWYEGESRLAPGIGYNSRGDVGWGVSWNLADVEMATGPGWYTTVGSVFEAEARLRFPGIRFQGPQWYGIVGVAIPSFWGMDADGLAIIGVEPGVIGGVALETVNGHGGKILVYWNGESLGVGIVGYVDFWGWGNPVAGGTGE